VNTTLRKLLALSGAAGLALDTACFTYGPAMTSPPPPGAEVRVQLNSEGTTELARYLGPRVIAVDGKLSSVSSDGAMMIAAVWVQMADGARQRWTGEDVVAFPRGYLTSVQLRTLDGRKSTIAAIAVAASFVVLGTIVMRGGGSSSAPTGTGPGTGVFIR
jgi:hypothetical protein